MTIQENSSTWKSETGYVWSLIGSAVGFANILSFSAQVYKNGGGAFLIPYIAALFILGVPLLILEGLVGHNLKAPLVSAYGYVWGKMGKVLGWLAVLACLSIGGFYIVLTGYSLAYLYFTAAQVIPEDTQNFFLHTFLKTTSSISEFGQISWPILIATLSVAALTIFVLMRNIRDGIEKVCTIFMPLLAFIMVVFAVTVTFLPGGIDGWAYYLKPDFSRLLDPLLWRDVFGQLFFSLSLGLGIIVGYSRHTGKKTNVPRAMLYVALGDFTVSFVSGAAIFGCLAHIGYMQQIPFDQLLPSASTFEIGFVIFPKMFQFFGPALAQLIGVIFFFCVFIAGITGLFSIAESAAGNIEVEFKTSRKRAAIFSILGLTVLALFFCMGNASHLIDALEPMVMGTNMLIGGLALILTFQFACKEVSQDSIWWTGKRRSIWGVSLRYFAPVFLTTILVGNLMQEFASFDLVKMVRWSWLLFALSGALLLTQLAEKRQLKLRAT